MITILILRFLYLLEGVTMVLLLVVAVPSRVTMRYQILRLYLKKPLLGLANLPQSVARNEKFVGELQEGSRRQIPSM